MIRYIIFDFGGVILKHKATVTEDILSQMFPQHSDIAINAWSTYRKLLMTGKKTSADFIIELKNSTQTKLSTDVLKRKWKELYKKEAEGVNWDLVEYIDKLKENYSVFMFTDTIDVHDEYNKTRGIYDKFHTVYKSYEEGVAKLEGKSAFEYLLKKMNAKPSECLFIDDLERNVELARETGMSGIIFKNFEELKESLKNAGITL